METWVVVAYQQPEYSRKVARIAKRIGDVWAHSPGSGETYRGARPDFRVHE